VQRRRQHLVAELCRLLGALVDGRAAHLETTSA